MINKRVANIIAFGVFTVWAVSFIVSAVPGSSYQTPPEIHGVMMVVSGAAFAAGAVRRDE